MKKNKKHKTNTSKHPQNPGRNKKPKKTPKIQKLSSVSRPRLWLFRIATNEINAHLRQSIRRRELLEAAARMGRINAAVSTSLLANETPVDWEEVYQALDELSDREQSIISLRFFAGFKHDQIANALDIETGTVRVALNRALNKLRDRLRDPKIGRRSAPRTIPGGNLPNE